MADQENNQESPSMLVSAAKAIGSVAGKVAASLGAGSEKPVVKTKASKKRARKSKATRGEAAGKAATAAAKTKESVWKAENLGSGTFLITKPKRKDRKRRQSALKGAVRGARK